MICLFLIAHGLSGSRMMAPHDVRRLAQQSMRQFVSWNMSTNSVTPPSNAVQREPETEWIEGPRLLQARSRHCAATVSGSIYVIGGQDPPTSTVFKLDNVTQSWSQTKSMQIAREWFATAVLDGSIWAIGGGDGCSESDGKSVEMFDPLRGSWKAGRSMKIARTGHAAAVSDGRIFVSGGLIWDSSSGLDCSWYVTDSMEVYDSFYNDWVPRASMTTLRSDHRLAALNGKIYAVGGCTGYGDPGEKPCCGCNTDGRGSTKSTEVYDIHSNSWSPGPDLNTEKRRYFALESYAGKLYAIGGGDGDSGQIASMEFFDPSLNKWSLGPTSLIHARGEFDVALLGGWMFALGGTGAGNDVEKWLVNNVTLVAVK